MHETKKNIKYSDMSEEDNLVCQKNIVRYIWEDTQIC